MRSYLLLLRFAVVNAVALAVLTTLWLQGWVSLVFDSDITHLTVVISAVFAVGLTIATAKVWRCSHELNAVRADQRGAETRLRWYRDLTGRAAAAARGILADCLRSRLYARIAVVRTMANSLVVLGLIGTVVGFIIALSGVDTGAATDAGSQAALSSRLQRTNR